MIRVPRVMPSNLGPDFFYNDELARLKAQRDQLRAAVAQQRATANWIPSWFHLIMFAMIAGFGLLLFLAERISASGLALFVVIGGVLLFILTRRVRIFGKPYYVGLFTLGLLDPPPLAADLAAEPNASDLLADCEYKISKLKDDRS